MQRLRREKGNISKSEKLMIQREKLGKPLNTQGAPVNRQQIWNSLYFHYFCQILVQKLERF